MDFIENITLEIPNISERLSELAESAKANKNKALIVEIASIHEGVTANHTAYSAEELDKAVETWTTPYPRPIIINHDRATDPLGRIVNAKMDKKQDGTPFIRLQAMVSDPAAVERVRDGRYLTGSVGGAAGKVNCSICEADWSNASMFSPAPCDHKRGKEYDGKKATLKMADIEFKEYSFVNTPADQKSQILSIGESEGSATESGLSHSIKFFSLDLNAGSVFEITEDENVNVLAKLPEGEAKVMYENLKTVFLSSLLEDDKSEDNMEEETAEDVLEALASLEASDDETPEEDVVDDDEESKEDVPEAAEDEAPKDDDEADEIVATDDPAKSDDDDGAEAKSEEDELIAELEEEVEDLAEDTNTELNEKIMTLESRVAELEVEKGTLTQKNTQLKAALKKMLAEHAVDVRISVGLANEEDREALVTEFNSRSVQSLADSIKDAQAIAKKQPRETITKIPSQTAAILDDEPKVEENQKANPEDVLVDVLMGRRSL